MMLRGVAGMPALLVIGGAAVACAMRPCAVRRRALVGGAAAVVAAPAPRARAVGSAIADTRDRAARYEAFSAAVEKGAASRADVGSVYRELVAFEKEFETLSPTREASDGAKVLRKNLGELYKLVVDGGEALDGPRVGRKLGEIAAVVAYLADSLEAARRSGIFLDDVVIGKLRSDWEPGPGYEYVKARTYSPT